MLWRLLVFFFAAESLACPCVSSAEVQHDGASSSTTVTEGDASFSTASINDNNDDKQTSLPSTTANDTCPSGGNTGTKGTIAYIPHIDPSNEEIIRTYFAENDTTNNLIIQQLHPIGATVTGIDLRRDEEPPEHVLQAFEAIMAERGLIVFKGQYNLTADELVRASEWWGGGAVHSTHGTHRANPRDANGNVHKDILRVSNDKRQGVKGVGPQWHHDGSFLSGTFSHVAYYIVQAPEQRDAGTHFAHLGAAYDALTAKQKEYWSRLASVNSNSGAVHPVVHEHYLSKRKSVWLHLGLTGAVIEKKRNGSGYRTLNAFELKRFMNEYNDLLNAGFHDGYSIAYEYEPGDCIFTDNLAVAHRASPTAHLSQWKQGLRILHRVTVHAVQDFPPTLAGDHHDEKNDDDGKVNDNLPQFLDITKPNPFNDAGVWVEGNIGFRWDDTIAFQN